MDEESTAPEGVENQPAEIEAPEVEAEEPASPEGEEAEGEEQAVEEEVEFDLGGGQKVKFKANATAKEVMEEAQRAFKTVEGNYTKKQQTVAEQARAIEAEKQAVEKLRNLNGAALEEYSRGLSIKAEIEQLSKTDLQALWQSNPDQARRVSDRISQKQAEFQQVVQKVSQIEAEQAEAEAAQVASRLEAGKAEIEKRIPGFAEKHAADVVRYAIANGIPEKDAGNWPANPIVTQMAWKAMQFDALQAKAKQAAKPKPTEAQPIAPSGGKGGKTNRSIADMSMDEYAAYMNKRDRERGRR